MFPFTYNKTIRINCEPISEPELKPLFDIFLRKFDEAEVSYPNLIWFDNINSMFRHKWLDDGELQLVAKNRVIEASLTLNFYVSPIVLLFANALFLAMGLSEGGDIRFAFFGTFFLDILWGIVPVDNLCFSHFYFGNNTKI